MLNLQLNKEQGECVLNAILLRMRASGPNEPEYFVLGPLVKSLLVSVEKAKRDEMMVPTRLIGPVETGSGA